MVQSKSRSSFQKISGPVEEVDGIPEGLVGPAHVQPRGT
jgi:hypothetical protein